MPIHIYENWNKRLSDEEEQIEPYRKYFFICEGANTETFYFKRLIDQRKELGIHPLIDMRLLEKTDEDRNMSYAKNLFEFAQKLKGEPENGFDMERDKMVIVFDGDVFEEKVSGYNELIAAIENDGDIPAVTNPGFELFLILHYENAYEMYVKGKEKDYLTKDEKNKYSYAYNALRELSGMNAKKNREIGYLADNVKIAIIQEKFINQNVHDVKGKVSSNLGRIIEGIINEEPSV